MPETHTIYIEIRGKLNNYYYKKMIIRPPYFDEDCRKFAIKTSCLINSKRDKLNSSLVSIPKHLQSTLEEEAYLKNYQSKMYEYTILFL